MREVEGREKNKMASLNVAFGMVAVKGRTFVTKVTKRGRGVEEEKGSLDWILASLTKDDQLLETGPILKKAEDKNPAVGSKKSTSSVSVPNKKFPGFGGPLPRTGGSSSV